MKQNELAEKAGISVQHITYLKRGHRTMLPRTAELFEKITGIPKLMWLYPKEHGDPWALLKELNTS